MTLEDAEKLKPIPKYIAERILKRDEKDFDKSYRNIRFYAYLALWKRKELIKYTIAVKRYRKKQFMKVVAIHAVHAKICYVKDLEYNHFSSMGFRVGWYAEGIQKYKKWFERGWCWANDKYYDPFAPIVNLEVIDKLPEYKYSAFRQYGYVNLFKYLRMYEKYPQAELFVKFGLSAYVLSEQLLEKTSKDKKFRTWLLKHRDELSSEYCYVSTILQAYRSGKSLKETQKLEQQKKSFCNKNSYYSDLRKFFKGRIDKFLEYIDKQGTDISSYQDYFRACNELGLDMTEDKNVFPHDFKRWHDIRIDEYHTAKALKDEAERKTLYGKFEDVANKYLALQRDMKEAFVVVIAKSPAELIREGDVLHHCVGSMNYDQRFVREESLIFFVRNVDAPDVPYVTLEYSLKSKKVIQCYGEHNHRPDTSVMEFINNKWLPYANRKLKQINKAA